MKTVILMITAGLGLMFVSNAFGQWTPADDRISKIRSSKSHYPKQTAKTSRKTNGGGNASNHKLNSMDAQYNSKELQVKQNRKTKATGNEVAIESIERRERTRKRKH